MTNATDLVAVAAIAVGAVGSSALYSLVPDRPSVVERSVVVRVTPPPAVTLEAEPPPAVVAVPGDLRIRHVPYVVYESRIPVEDESRDGVEERTRRNGSVMELHEPERPSHPDRKQKRRPGGP